MIYFDSDVLVNYYVNQEPEKHARSIELYQNATYDDVFCCSFLALQETTYVLDRLDVNPEKTEKMIQSLFPYLISNYKLAHFERAMNLARKIGFRHINDACTPPLPKITAKSCIPLTEPTSSAFRNTLI